MVVTMARPRYLSPRRARPLYVFSGFRKPTVPGGLRGEKRFLGHQISGRHVSRPDPTGRRLMAESAIPVDLHNPGQVFACLGVMEMSEILLGEAMAAFDWGSADGPRFRISAVGSESPVRRAMRFLDEAIAVTKAPTGSTHVDRWKESWGSAPEIANPEDSSYPFPEPDSPATLAVILRDKDQQEIPVDYWGDVTKRDNVKFWAGAGGYPGAALLRDALDCVCGEAQSHSEDPFQLSRPQDSSFRFDWRRDYVPIVMGFSPNKHAKMSMVGFPLVEILAAVGLSNARPRRRTKLEYEYGVLGSRDTSLLDPVFHRAALGAISSPVPGQPFRRFVMRLDWPGKENQARCITHVFERSRRAND